MAKGKDRPKKEPKRKKAPKAAPVPTGAVAPSYQPPMRPVEVIKPKRREREQPEPQDTNPQDEG